MWEASFSSSRLGADTGAFEFKDNFLVSEWYANYQISKHSGLELNLEKFDSDVISDLSFHNMQAALSFRFGTNDFRQSFVLGLRQSNFLEYWQESGLSKTNLLTGRSLILGLKMLGRLPNAMRLHIDLLYGSPNSVQGSGDLRGDQFFAQVGLAKKLYKKLWLSYYLAYESQNIKFENNQEGKTAWKSSSFTPLKIALEYRH